VFRHLARFAAILAILIVAAWAKGQWQSHEALQADGVILAEAKPKIETHVRQLERDAGTRIRHLQQAGIARLDDRIRKIDAGLANQRNIRGKTNLVTLLASQPLAGGLADKLMRDVEIQVMEKERVYLAQLRSVVVARDARQSATRKLEAQRLAHVKAYSRVKALEQQRGTSSPIRYCTQVWKTRNPFDAVAHSDLKQACTNNAAAASAYREQSGKLRRIDVPRIGRFDPCAQCILQPLDDAIAKYQARLDKNVWEKLRRPINEWWPAALQLTLAVMLLPALYRWIAYYVIAPWVTRRPPLRLLPAAAGMADALADAPMPGRVSVVSLPVTIDATEELLLRPDFLQSIDIRGSKDTQLWLAGAPLSSAASGMVELTRLRAAEPVIHVVSATLDPLAEVSILSIPQGAAFVFQPRALAGIVQLRDQPMRISSHWRLGSLHAWLTLQLRFLVLHGPVRLIVKGCRGVRVEPAGSGRSMHQAATLGFNAGLAYSAVRCETFWPYFRGKSELYEDLFAGDGCYVVEEMPHGGRPPGFLGMGRGWEGIADAFMKVFGI
jgi:hypothetical protein